MDDLIETPASSSQPPILDQPSSRPSFRRFRPTTDGPPRLVPVQPWHFHYFLTPEEAENLSGRALGRTLVSSEGTPLGFGGVYLDENGKGEAVAIVYFYGGPNQYFARKYLVMVMRGVAQCAQVLQDMGFKTLYAIADQNVPDSDKFIEWTGGVRIEERDSHGPIYELEIEKLLAKFK